MAANQTFSLLDTAEVGRRLHRRLTDAGLLDDARRDAAAAACSRGARPATALVQAGLPEAAVRAAFAEATELPCCPVTLTWAPDPALRAAFSDDVWRQAAAIPFARDGDVLHIAFADLTTARAAVSSLPPHIPFACLEIDVERGLSPRPVASPPSSLSSPPVGTAMLDAVMPPPVARAAPSATTPTTTTPTTAPAPGAPGTLVLDAAMLAPAQTAMLYGAAPSASGATMVFPLASSELPPSRSLPPSLPVLLSPPALVSTTAGTGRIGPFRIEGVLGQGGMATVYRGVHDDGRLAAVKVVHPHLLHQPLAKERFLREARATERLRHDNVVAVLGAGEDQGTAWLAVEFVDGGSVADLLRRLKRLPLFAALEIVAQTVEALGAAHAMGIVHRDLKPDNLLLTRDGVIKLADFGIARDLEATAMTGTGSTLGTPAYMSPEQAMAKDLDGRSDLYAVGVILYELLVGTNPFEGDSLGTTVARILQQKVPPLSEVDPSSPEAVDGIVGRLIRFNPSDRPADAAALRDILRPLIDEQRRRFPRLLADLIGAPERADELRRVQADDLVAAGRALLQMGPSTRDAAAMCLFRATCLVPEHDDARRLLGSLEAAHGLRFGEARNPRIADVERELLSSPDDPVLLQRAAQLWRQDGNLHKAAIYLRRSLKVRPEDAHAQAQLSRLVVPAAVGTSARIASHIVTGGFIAPALGGERPIAIGPSEAGSSSLSSSPSGPGAEAVMGLGEQLRAFGSQHGRSVVGVVAVGALIAGSIAGVRSFITGSRTSIDEAWQRGPQKSGPVDDTADQRALEATRTALDKGLYAEAAREATTVIERNARASAVASALGLRAEAAMKQNQTLSAVEDLTRIIDRFGAHEGATEALLRRGQLYARVGDANKALLDLEACLKRRPQAPTRAEALVERGELLAKAGDVTGAREALEMGRSFVSPGSPLNARAKAILQTLSPLPATAQ